MKNLLILITIMVASCATPLTPEQKALRDSVLGEYERKEYELERESLLAETKRVERDTYKQVFLDNGAREWYKNGKKESERKWKIVDGEIHVKYNNRLIGVFRINTDKSITHIAYIHTRNGERELVIDGSGREFNSFGFKVTTWKKIKSLRDSVVGEYELKHDTGATLKNVFLDNGVFEWYQNGVKGGEVKWTISNGEIHSKSASSGTGVFRINTDKSITQIAKIDKDGIRRDLFKRDQSTYKRIK